MKDENIIQLAKLSGGVLLAIIYAVTGFDGVLILIAAFLLGIPLDKVYASRTDK